MGRAILTGIGIGIGLLIVWLIVGALDDDDVRVERPMAPVTRVVV